MKKIAAFFIFCVIAIAAAAQADRDELLAASYLKNGEYEKAVMLYTELWENNNQSPKFFQPLLRALTELKKYDEAERITKKQIKKYTDNNTLLVDLGYIYQLKNDPAKAKEQYEKAIKNIRPNADEVELLAKTFRAYTLTDEEIATYERTEKLFKGNISFTLELGDAFRRKTAYNKAATVYMNGLSAMPGLAQAIKNQLQTAANGDKVLAEMETQLYAKIQKEPDNDELIDFLTWIYIQNKDFEGALLQMKALDRRKNETGIRVLNIARMAQTEGAYDDAIAGYNYVISKQPQSPLYFQAKTELLNCRKEQVSKTLHPTMEQLIGLKNEYLSFINENGKSVRTAQSIKELAELEGFYIHDLNAAIATAEELIAMPGIPQRIKNETKLSLGDFYLMDGDVWESTLLYSQVDKDEKETPMGEDARFRNAKLSYYKGDFEVAQDQMNILKNATSQLISNDAIELSTFIIDNAGLDTTFAAMELYAQADLLLFQNKYSEAMQKLDSLTQLYPGNDLYDDVMYAKAKILLREKKTTEAMQLLEHIVKDYGTDLKGDDATFLLGEIYEKEIGDKEKAKEYYKKVITDYTNSLLVIEARKRYRMLRGDKIE